MTRLVLALGLLGALTLSPPAKAQAIYLHGGAGIARSSTPIDNQKVGFNAGVGIGFPFARGGEVILRGNVDRFESNVQDKAPFIALSGTANLKASAPTRNHRWTPYVLVGGGLFYLGTEDNYNTEAGLQFGVGLNIRTSPTTNLLLEPNYVLVPNGGNNTQYIPIRVGGVLIL